MPDKITMISLVWMTMVFAMLTATITLYNTNTVNANNQHVPTVTASSHMIRQY